MGSFQFFRELQMVSGYPKEDISQIVSLPIIVYYEETPLTRVKLVCVLILQD